MFYKSWASLNENSASNSLGLCHKQYHPYGSTNRCCQNLKKTLSSVMGMLGSTLPFSEVDKKLGNLTIVIWHDNHVISH